MRHHSCNARGAPAIGPTAPYRERHPTRGRKPPPARGRKRWELELDWLHVDAPTRQANPPRQTPKSKRAPCSWRALFVAETMTWGSEIDHGAAKAYAEMRPSANSKPPASRQPL